MTSKNKNLLLLLFFKKNIYIILSALKSAGLKTALPYTAKDICRKNISPMMARMIFRLSDRFLKWSFFINFNAGRIK